MAVTIVQPIASEVVSGTYVIQVQAATDAKIVEVNFDSNEWHRCVKISADGSYSYWEYSWDTKEFSNIEHTIVARALA